mgnify:FL=1
MKLHLSQPAGIRLITGHGPGYLEIDRARREHSVILLPDRVLDWSPDRFEAIDAASLQALIELHPALVILGTGTRHRFPHPSVYRNLIEAGIGVEHMTTAAACRTYNVLAGEGRLVAAAMIVGTR